MSVQGSVEADPRLRHAVSGLDPKGISGPYHQLASVPVGDGCPARMGSGGGVLAKILGAGRISGGSSVCPDTGWHHLDKGRSIGSVHKAIAITNFNIAIVFRI